MINYAITYLLIYSPPPSVFPCFFPLFAIMQILCEATETGAGGLWVHFGAAWLQGDQLAVR